MSTLTENKIILIVRKTRLDELISRFNTLLQAQFYLEHLGADFSSYQQEDRVYKQAVQLAQKILGSFGRVQTVDRQFLPNFVFGKNDTVVVIGQDGLVANVLKYLDQQPVIGLNPDPEHLEGVLLPFYVPDLYALLPRMFRQDHAVHKISIAKAELTNGHILYGVNDFFIGAKSHVSARYRLEIGSESETQSSSGVIVSTGLGSTGWLKSILAGARGISAALSGQAVNMPEHLMAWDADYLYFSVREPWPSKNSAASITFGKITRDQPLQIHSQMPENGVIFSDGIEQDFVEFQAGTMATITLADKQGHLVVK
jgi:NAD kinase